MTNWSISTFKVKLKFFRCKIIKYETWAFNRKFEIKPNPSLLNISLTASNHFWHCCLFLAWDLIYNYTGYVIKQLDHAFSCALSSYGALGSLESNQEARVALGYRLRQLLPIFHALQTSHMLHYSIVHAKAWTNC